jgi:hypothetical protein
MNQFSDALLPTINPVTKYVALKMIGRSEIDNNYGSSEKSEGGFE